MIQVIHGKPYVPPKTRITVRAPKRGSAAAGLAGRGPMSPRQIYEQQQQEAAQHQKKRKLMRRICLPDGFKLQVATMHHFHVA